jgi:hypothetical protein
MTTKTTREIKTVVDILRPSGAVETVDVTATYGNMIPASAWEQIKANTVKAGRGTPIAWRNVETVKEVAVTALELALNAQYAALEAYEAAQRSGSPAAVIKASAAHDAATANVIAIRNS